MDTRSSPLPSSPVAMPSDICCSQFRALLTVVEQRLGRPGVERLLVGVVDNGQYLLADRFDPTCVRMIAESDLRDPACWVANDVSLQLLANAAALFPPPDGLIWVGQECMRHHVSRTTMYVANLVGPESLIRNAPRINAKFNRTKIVTVCELAHGRVVFDLRPRPGVRVTKDVCAWARGCYMGLALAAGARDVASRELACAAEGAESCQLEITWKLPSLRERFSRYFVSRASGDLVADYDRTLAERDRLIASLRESEERYRKLTDNSLTGIYIARGGLLLYANPRLVDLLGLPLEELLGRELWEFAQPEDAHLVSEKSGFPQPGTAHLPIHFEFRARRADGVATWLEVLATEIDYRGEPAVLGNVIDVSQRHRIEEEKYLVEAQLQQAQRLEAVGRLAGGVAHDFNNLLTCILGTAPLLERRLEPGPQRQDLQVITNAAERAAILTRQLLAFSRKQVLCARVMDLNVVLDNVVHMLRRVMGEDIELVVQHGELDSVMADPGQIEQVILNLALNARDAMPGGGKLSIATERLLIQEGEVRPSEGMVAGSWQVLRLRDTGTGIDPACLPHIFEPFFTTKPQGRGTGLGLAMVHGIVKQSQGHITVSTGLGQGTLFTVFLPAAKAKAAAEVVASPSAANMDGKETVLVAEDDEVVRSLVRRILEGRGYRVVEAQNGGEALDVLRNRDPRIEVLVTDAVMPRLSGREVARQGIEMDADLRVVLMSGYADDEVLNLGLVDPRIVLLRKPFSPRELASKLREAMCGPPSEDTGIAVRGAAE